MELVDTAKNIHHTGIPQCVKNLRPATLIHHQPDAAQHGKVVRNRGNIEADKCGEIGHAVLAPAQRIHDEQSTGIAQRLENIRSLAEIRRRFAQPGIAGGVRAAILCWIPCECIHTFALLKVNIPARRSKCSPPVGGH